MEIISRSEGVTESERVLSDYCDRSFLKLWTYPNPYKDDGKELCDVLAVFGDHVFIFFDRQRAFSDAGGQDPLVAWNRWKRGAVDRQIVTAHGAERYIRSGRRVFLDAKRRTEYPIPIDLERAIFHKVVVAHGAKDACKGSSDENIYGSLAITYTNSDVDGMEWPFHVAIDKRNPVHIFDSHNLPIVLGELDTVSDLSRYLDEKVRAINRLNLLSYSGEEDLLSHYLLNFDDKLAAHVIGPSEAISGLVLEQGDWHKFVHSDVYLNTKREDEVSYFWDELIQRTCENALNGVLGGNSDLFRGKSAIFEMVKEPRFVRRALSSKMRDAIINFPGDPSQMMRQITFMPSFNEGVGYVFFQFHATDYFRTKPDYLEKRRTLLEIACGVARNKFAHLKKVVGIGMDAPKFAGETNSEDFVLLPCEEWPDVVRDEYDRLNELWRFFETPQLNRYEETVTQFVQPASLKRAEKPRRNDPCPCGSGKKYKKCHGR